jgi:hypothetical protein
MTYVLLPIWGLWYSSLSVPRSIVVSIVVMLALGVAGLVAFVWPLAPSFESPSK